MQRWRSEEQLWVGDLNGNRFASLASNSRGKDDTFLINRDAAQWRSQDSAPSRRR